MIQPWKSEEQRYEYPLQPTDLVIDAGCYEGDFAAGMDARYGCQIIALEPVPQFFQNCVHRFSLRPNIRMLNYALFNHDGPMKMGLSNNSSGINSTGANIDVEGIRFATLLQHHVYGQVSLLKLNIEGAEFPVLADIVESGLMPRIDRLQVQWHGIENFQREYGMLRDKILRTHTHVWGENPLFWESYELKR